MENIMKSTKRILLKERDTGAKKGDKQKNHEGGRGGQGTRPSGQGQNKGSQGGKRDKNG